MNPTNKRPQPARPKAQIVQQKKAATLQMKRPAAAPPVYRPQPVPRVLQKKSANVPQSPQGQVGPKPVAPPVYKPQPTPKCLQMKRTQAPVRASGKNNAAGGPKVQASHSAGLIQRQTAQSNNGARQVAFPRAATTAAGGAVIQRAMGGFVMNVMEQTDTTPVSGFVTILKLTVNGQDICHTKSGELVPDVESAHAEDMAFHELMNLCADAVSGTSTVMNPAAPNNVYLYISSSPCTSTSRNGLPATSSKDIGCAEMLMYIQQHGIPCNGSLWSYGPQNQVGPTFQINFNISYGHLYQPQAPGGGPLAGGKAASQAAVNAMQAAGIHFY